MHVFGQLASRNAIYQRASTTLTDRFRDILSDPTVTYQDSFDRWHDLVTKKITEVFTAG
jgi:hypothetical protein